MATSGTVSATTFETRKIIDHAGRRAGLTPQQLAGENLETALDLLYLYLSTLSSNGIPLWAIQKYLRPVYEATYQIALPEGVVDVLNATLRKLDRVSGSVSSSEGTAENATDGDLSTACTQTVAAGNIQVELESAERVSNFGIMPNVTETWNIKIQGSEDGTSWTDIYEDDEFEAVEGEWQWFDVQGVSEWTFYRLLGVDTTVLDVTEFYLGNSPQEINLAELNRDSYVNLPNKQFSGRPTQYWYDKQRSRTVMHVWPSPSSEYTFRQLVVYASRHVEDVGTMTQELEVPQRWFMTVIARLAMDLCRELKEADKNLLPDLQNVYTFEEKKAWTGESGSATTRLTPNIGVYTR